LPSAPPSCTARVTPLSTLQASPRLQGLPPPESPLPHGAVLPTPLGPLLPWASSPL
jgi:hypothetical protein